jgi:hypothetical protein
VGKQLLNNEPNFGHHFTLFNEVNKRGGMTIFRETNEEIPDTHLGESGHKIQADLFYEYLTDVQTINNEIV